jgi:hypothetical protein
MDTRVEHPPRRAQADVAAGGSGMTVEQILCWAVEHRAATSRWPTRWAARPPHGAGVESWQEIDRALRLGLAGLPGRQSLDRLLHDQAERLDTMRKAHALTHPRRRAGGASAERRYLRPSRLSSDEILAWADAHRAATGSWPSQHSGPIAGAPGETWSKIGSALCNGTRGLPGGTTLKRLLLEHRAPDVPAPLTRLTVEAVLHWADLHRREHGVWPTAASGGVDQVPGLTWADIDNLLKRGGRGLPRAGSLVGLLAQKRWGPPPRMSYALTIDQILAWADAHHACCGKWPTAKSGHVTAAPGEWWSVIDAALKRGYRGLKGGSSLSLLLAEHRSMPPRTLSVELILDWAKAHHAGTGRWPSAGSGVIGAAPDETWSKINAALWKGCRGLPGGLSLAKLFAGRDAAGDLTGAGAIG